MIISMTLKLDASLILLTVTWLSSHMNASPVISKHNTSAAVRGKTTVNSIIYEP